MWYVRFYKDKKYSETNKRDPENITNALYYNEEISVSSENYEQSTTVTLSGYEVIKQSTWWHHHWN